jgi:toxin ParE1/3/4
LRRLRWTARASADVVDALRYYKAIDPLLALMLRKRIAAAPTPLVERPGLGSPTGQHDTRKWRVRGTPFLLLYRILVDGTVEILRVHHTAQNWRPE